MADIDELLEQGEKILKKGVKCPHCLGDDIEVIRTTVTLIYPLPHPPPTYDPNTYTTEYKCRNCEKRFWIDRKVELIEEYVFEENGRTKRVRKM